MPSGTAEAERPMRTLLVLVLVSALCTGCKEPQGSLPAVDLVSSSQDVKVNSIRTASATDNAGDSLTQFYICTVSFTNHLNRDFIPQVEKFYLEDSSHQRYRAVSSGSSVLAGTTNDFSILKKDDSREYTLAFRVPFGVFGRIYYDPT